MSPGARRYAAHQIAAMVNDQLGGMGSPLWYVRNGQTVANGGRAPVSSNRPLLSVTNTFRSRAMHAAGPVCINQLSVRLLPYAKALTTLRSKYWRVAGHPGRLLKRVFANVLRI